jgi:hypothetical protein
MERPRPATTEELFNPHCMNTNRRKMLIGLGAIPFSVKIGLQVSAQDVPETGTGLTGSWQVTSASNSVVLSIEPSGQALVLMMQSGAHSMVRTKWRLLPGGLLVEGLPRFRLWAGPDQQHLRAEMDLPARADVGDGWREFPVTFFMSRIGDARFPEALLERPLPVGWDKAVLDKDWDQKAGQRRRKTQSGSESSAPPKAAAPDR